MYKSRAINFRKIETYFYVLVFREILSLLLGIYKMSPRRFYTDETNVKTFSDLILMRTQRKSNQKRKKYYILFNAFSFRE